MIHSFLHWIRTNLSLEVPSQEKASNMWSKIAVCCQYKYLCALTSDLVIVLSWFLLLCVKLLETQVSNTLKGHSWDKMYYLYENILILGHPHHPWSHGQRLGSTDMVYKILSCRMIIYNNTHKNNTFQKLKVHWLIFSACKMRKIKLSYSTEVTFTLIP